MDLRKLVRNRYFQIGILAITFGIIAMVAGGCSSSSTTHRSLASRTECAVQYHHWYANGGKGIVLSIEKQAGPIAQALQAKDTSQLKGLTSALQSDTAQLASHMPPNCIPGADHDLTLMLAYLNKAAVQGQANKLSQAQAALKKAGEEADQLGKDVKNYVK